MTTKAAINLEIKGNGRVHHRTRGETVNVIQRYLERYGSQAIPTVMVLLWSLGFSWEDAKAAATRLTQHTRQSPR